MKIFLTTFLMLISVQTFAENQVEFDETHEMKCYEEARKLGCVKNDQENTACTEKKKDRLSTLCKKMHETRKQHGQ